MLGILAGEKERERERDSTNIPISRSFRGLAGFLRVGERGTVSSISLPETWAASPPVSNFQPCSQSDSQT